MAELAKHVNHQTGLAVGIDENPEGLAAAATRLSIEAPQQRLFHSPGPTRNYDVQIVAGRTPKAGSIVLMQADVLRPDDEFEAWIVKQRPFDAVTFWFTGIHPGRQYDNIISELAITSDMHHRMANDLAVLDLAGAIFSPGGILHIAQRAIASREIRVRTSTVDELKALLEHGPFRIAEIADMSLFEYSEPTLGPRIGVPSEGNSSYVISTILRLEG
ncbi:hypothetical protein [Mesorhizobium sp. NZP2077]|uniref:hypothetical protein n=1 Tax=Mesorhizobium sp. NZP2077 TaxID=2483404 RepID=UPI0015529682|nr:hypothetical protein [Mesorhizobium sp. NZP2077]QKC86932.1 hypothetical protein EB232_35650 [Mesorhizobium sp. NZP2077]QKD20636.1 hypothetical protein HGP13_37585 [Mesorhizobium sp. NZP2077]